MTIENRKQVERRRCVRGEEQRGERERKWGKKREREEDRESMSESES